MTMRRQNTESIGALLRDFFEENTEFYEKIMEVRIVRGWGVVLGEHILNYTRNIYVRDRVLHVSMTSAVIRSELMLCRDRLVKSLNDYAGHTFLHDIVIR